MRAVTLSLVPAARGLETGSCNNPLAKFEVDFAWG